MKSEFRILNNILLFLVLSQPLFLCAQHRLVPETTRPVYFDISPPLRNLKPAAIPGNDKSWKEGFVKNEIRGNIPIDNFRNDGLDTVIQVQPGHPFPDTLLQNFDGLGNVSNVVPPDTHGDAGPFHYFQMVNMAIAIYSKVGEKLLGPLNSSSIWEGLPHNSNNGDGVVLYDEQADRWLISQFSFPSFPVGPFYQMVAVSQTPDPTGAWYRWEYMFGDLPDYPKFGIWPDGYYMSYTRLKSQTLNEDGVGAAVFDRNAMIGGYPDPQCVRFSVPLAESPVSLLPADCDGAFPPLGTPNCFGYFRNGSIVLRELHADWVNPAASTLGSPLILPVSPFSYSQDIPQKGSDKFLTSLSDRLMYRLQHRVFKDYHSMVVNHTIGVGSHAGIRWYELRKTNADWFIHQQGTFAPDTLNRWMGSIAQDSAGNIALGYSVSGLSLYPSIRFTGRTKNDPPGQMTILEKTIMDGTGSQTGIWDGQSRWGDYSTMTVDPSVPSTFWYAQEYYAATSNNCWKTRVASFSFVSLLNIQATATPQAVCAGDSAALNLVISGGTGDPGYLWSSVPPGFVSSVKSPVVAPATQTTYIVRVTSGSQVKTDSVVVDVVPPPTAFAGTDTVVCHYLDLLSLTGIATNYRSVNWQTSGDGYFSEPGELKTQYHFGVLDKPSDTLFLTLTAYPSVACQPVSANRRVVIDACSAVGELPDPFLHVNLWPNPAHETIFVEIEGGREEVSLTVCDVLDRELYSEIIRNPAKVIRARIEVSAFPRGIYFLKVQTGQARKIMPFVVHE